MSGVGNIRKQFNRTVAGAIDVICGTDQNAAPAGMPQYEYQ
jgi:hypothetical protein